MRQYRQSFTEQEAEQKEKAPSRFKIFFCETGRLLFLSLCSMGSASLLVASYPNLSHSMLAWVALAPFVWGVTKIRRFWSSFFYSWITGFFFFTGVFSWIYYTCLHGGGLSAGLSVAAWLGLSALMALPFACWGGSCFFLKRTQGFFPVLAACGFVAWEWLHQTIAYYGLGFPWVMLGYTQWNSPELIQLASITGVYGVSFVIAFVGASLGWAFAVPGVRKGTWHMVLGGIVFVAAFSFGHYRLPDSQKNRPNALLSVSAALIQPNIDQYKKWNADFETEIQQTLADMGTQLEGEKVRLTVWPESAVPGSLGEETYQQLFENIATRTGSYQFIGSNVFTDGKQYVGGYLMAPNSDELQEYRKIKLVPFGEYIPLEKTIRSLFSEVAVLGELGAFLPGPREQSLLNMEGVLLGSTICYESIYPQLWLAQNKKGAKLFLNITNDGWFFDTAAPYQHLAVNVLRAVEMGRPVLRAANTGFSAIIDPFGRIQQKSGLFTQEILQTSVPLAVGEDKTLYTQWGDLFAWLCVALYFTLLISTMVFAYE